MFKNTDTLGSLLYSADCDFQPSESYVIIYLFMCKVLYQNMLLISIIMIFKFTIWSVCLHQPLNINTRIKEHILFSSNNPIHKDTFNSNWACFPALQTNGPIHYLMNIVIELHEIRLFQKFFPNFCDHFAIDTSIQNDVLPVEISLCTCSLRISLDRNTTY